MFAIQARQHVLQLGDVSVTRTPGRRPIKQTPSAVVPPPGPSTALGTKPALSGADDSFGKDRKEPAMANENDSGMCIGDAMCRGVERAVLMQVGAEVYSVYGSEEVGWRLGGRDLHSLVSPAFRYETLEELFFALVNFTLASEGRA
jgi:hypothetical protein